MRLFRARLAAPALLGTQRRELPCAACRNSFPSAAFHGGFGLLTLDGIAKPVYRAFQLLHGLGDERLLVDGLHHTTDAWVVRKKGGITMLLTNHALPRQPISRERVRMTLRNSARPRSVTIRRIDERHAHPRRVWHKLGEPDYLTANMLERLEAASHLQEIKHPYRYADRMAIFEVDLPPHSVASVAVTTRST